MVLSVYCVAVAGSVATCVPSRSTVIGPLAVVGFCQFSTSEAL